MQNYHQINKSFNFLEGVVAVFALVSIIGISTMLVIGLNPRANADETEGASVAGITTGILEPQFETLYLRARHDVNFVNNEESKKVITTINIPSMSKGSEVVDFIKVINTSERSRLNFNVEIQGDVQDELSLTLNDGTSVINLFSNGISNQYAISLDSNEEKSFQLRYDLDKTINFPFVVRITINYWL